MTTTSPAATFAPLTARSTICRSEPADGAVSTTERTGRISPRSCRKSTNVVFGYERRRQRRRAAVATKRRRSGHRQRDDRRSSARIAALFFIAAPRSMSIAAARSGIRCGSLPSMLNTARKVRTRFDIVLIVPICDSCSSRPVKARAGYESSVMRAGLADAERRDVGLIHARAHLHGRRVDDVHDAEAGPHLLAFLHLAHRAVLPGGLEHDHAVDRRHDPHLVGVALGVLPRVLRAVALDLERADVGGVELAPEIEGAANLTRPSRAPRRATAGSARR